MARNIGDSYAKAIGRSYVDARHTGNVVRGASSRTVWARIKEALHDRGLPETQVYAARMIGVEQPSVSDWNKPGMYPTLENAVTIAKKLGVCVEWLLTERGPKHPGPPGDELAQELWLLWEHLPAKVRRDLVGAANIAVADSTGVFPKGPHGGDGAPKKPHPPGKDPG